MCGLWHCLCCCCYPDKQSEKIKDRVKKHKDLKTLESITPRAESDQIWADTTNPAKVRTEQMTQMYVIPSEQFKTEMDVLQSLGYKMYRQIDSGSFGLILTAVHTQTNLKIAIKKIVIPKSNDKKTKEKRKELLNDVKHELFVLQTIRHPHVVKLIQHLMIKSKMYFTLYILMQLGENGNLEKYCGVSGPINEDKCKLWFAQMLSGLSFMHRRGIAHRDLKLANILLDSAFDVLIADFGLSRMVWRQSQGKVLMSNTYCGTPPYMAPEVMMVQKNNILDYNAFLADVWSLGVILFVLFCGVYPFPRRPVRALKHMRKKIWKFPVNRNPSSELQLIIKSLFEPNPQLRPRMESLQKYEWIKNVFRNVEMKSIQKMKENDSLI